MNRRCDWNLWKCVDDVRAAAEDEDDEGVRGKGQRSLRKQVSEQNDKKTVW